MKLFWCVLAATTFLPFANGSAVRSPAAGLKLEIADISPAGRITVKMNNTGKKTLRVWRDSNSWGAARWRVERVRKEVVEVFFQYPDQNFTANGPVFYELKPGAQVSQKLDLNGGLWCGSEGCSSYGEHGLAGKTVAFEAGDLIIAIYDVPNSDEAIRLDVWHGVAAASTKMPE
jgi:hypothetical protein